MQACEGIELEPSALAGLAGMFSVLQEQQGYRQRLGLSDERMARATHLVWGTGGSMVPRDEMDRYLAKGRAVLAGN
ncbi:D-serine dehydratase [compost metagenome]